MYGHGGAVVGMPEGHRSCNHVPWDVQHWIQEFVSQTSAFGPPSCLLSSGKANISHFHQNYWAMQYVVASYQGQIHLVPWTWPCLTLCK